MPRYFPLRTNDDCVVGVARGLYPPLNDHCNRNDEAFADAASHFERPAVLLQLGSYFAAVYILPMGMDTAPFLARVAEILDTSAPLAPGDPLPEYDSLMALSLLELFDELGASVDPENLGNIKTVDELLALASLP